MRDAASARARRSLKIFRFQALAAADSNGSPWACRNEWNPITPSPTLRSRSDAYRALAMDSGAFWIKPSSTLSRNRMTSSMKSGSSFHSS